MPPLERATSWITRGRSPLSGALVPSLVLHTIGAKSGLVRDIPLMYCPEPPDRILIVGSNFGRPDHPAWTLNLLAHPDAAVTVKGRRFDVRAELIDDRGAGRGLGAHPAPVAQLSRVRGDRAPGAADLPTHARGSAALGPDVGSNTWAFVTFL